MRAQCQVSSDKMTECRLDGRLGGDSWDRDLEAKSQSSRVGIESKRENRERAGHNTQDRSRNSGKGAKQLAWLRTGGEKPRCSTETSK